jgi:O-antigen ligase
MPVIALCIFLVAAFVLPSEAAFSLVFYLTLPVLAWKPRLDRRLMPALALIAWSALTLLWSAGGAIRAWHFLLGALCTAAFLQEALQALGITGARQFVTRLLVGLGSANAGLSLVLGAAALARGERILGWGVTRQPILGGSVMAVCCLSAIYLARQDSRRAPVYWAGAAVMTSFIAAMDSRGALLGFLCGGAVLLLSWPTGRRLAAGAIVICLALAISPVVRAVAARLGLARGDSHRLEIWQAALRAIEQRPLFGYGLGANLQVSPTGFPHSLYLSLLFYSGAVGLGLFVVMAAALIWRWRCAPKGAGRIWVAALGANALAAGLTDFGQITKGPGPLWLILWLPVALALSLEPTQCAKDAALPD